MIRALIPEPHHIEIVHQDLPVPGPGEALLRIRTVGICGSDLHTFEGKHPYVSYPVWPGHEVCAEVVSAGDAALVGRRVVIEPSLPGQGRPRFEPGRYNIATELAVMGFQAPGAMAEYFTCPTDRLHHLPNGFSDEMGALVEPAAVAVHGVRRAGHVAGLDAAVVGGGTIGILTAMVATAYGAAQVHLIEPDTERLEQATRMGLTALPSSERQRYDIVFECVGVEPALRSALLACRKGATLVVLGVFGAEASVPFGFVQDWELDIKGSLMYTGDDFREAIRLLAAGQLKIDRLVTHRFPLVEVERAFATALQRGPVLKVLLDV
ncbi:MAG: alcohol dehydrogenase catalytic domain-containing protein [Rhodothermales bacterium]|nr:alcohol dehydrogenase catalytic domain-containing protein [Rhodothermales bacterium]